MNPLSHKKTLLILLLIGLSLPPVKGTFQVRARYGGGDVYPGSESEPATLEVYTDYTPYAVAGSIAIVLLIVILLIKRRY